MENIDLSFFLEPPVLDTAAILTIEALAPLSMVPAQPGAYYRSQSHPTDFMIFGMLENSLGWHFSEKERNTLLKGLRKTAATKHKKLSASAWKDSDWLIGKQNKAGSGFTSLLAYHLEIETQFLPQVLSFDDYWLKHVNTGSKNSFLGSSRNHDYRVSEVFKRQQQGELIFGDGSEKNGFQKLTLEQMENAPNDSKIKLDSLKPYFPYYRNSPATRMYVVPSGPFQYRIKTTYTLEHLIMSALNNPKAPLYLGSNDGWVEAKWEQL